MKGEMDWDLILRYLDGTCSRSEGEKMQGWLAAEEEHKKTFERLQHIWSAPGRPLPKPDVEKALMSVAVRAGIHLELTKEKSDKTADLRVTPRIHRFPTFKLLRIAAVLAFMFAASYFSFKLLRPSSVKEISIARGDQKTFTLPDETRVTLDSGSRFRYSRSFEDASRTVFLNGEGYFEVSPDSEKPFVIQTDQAIVTVLGTMFNVRAWPQTKKVVVAVKEGKVSFRPESESRAEAEVVIEAGQISRLEEDLNPTTPEVVDIDEHTAWLNREMYFLAAPLEEVLDQLERWYGLEFALSDSTFAGNRITVFIERKSIDEILDMLSLVNNFEYDRQGKTVTFSPR
jgi:ferric-dicitrate binding protein FerR (iron transport regulator)